MNENLKNQEKAVVETENKEVETPADQATQPAQDNAVTVMVKPNLIDRGYQKYLDQRMKKAQAKEEKRKAKEEAPKEPKGKKALKILGGVALAAAGVTGALLFGGKGGSSDSVELEEGDITMNPAPAELGSGSLVETIDISEAAVPTTDEA